MLDAVCTPYPFRGHCTVMGEIMRKKAVFLDRDGTIARDVHFCCRVRDFEILPDVPRAIKLLNRRGFKVVVVTNQSGVARGYLSEEKLQQIHRRMRYELAKNGAFVDAIYCCTHDPGDECDCRKPKPGLLVKATRDLGIDLSHSFMIGDGERDIEAGKAAGCRTALINTNKNGHNHSVFPDCTAPDLLRAVRWVVDKATGPV